ncbi:MAG TPA: ABC transporter ATP-binding protein [Gammaproteobacteria bacterium]|nr:ABC transporter ATP-binding protein [Gammaproteobacteria bacterium]
MSEAAARLTGLVRSYWRRIAGLVLLTLLVNALYLVIPKLIAWAIDSNTAGRFRVEGIAIVFGVVLAGIFVFACFQSIAQTYTSALVARELRNRVAAKISGQDHAYVQRVGVPRILTNLTSDIDAIRRFVASAIVSMVSSAFVSVGAGALMFAIAPALALSVLLVVLVVGAVYLVVFRGVANLVVRSRAAIDALNGVINESIVGAALVRLLNSQQSEREKFLAVNSAALDVSLGVNRLVAGLVPVTALGTSLATLVILTLGGRFVVFGRLSLGDFVAFNSYVALLVAPIFVVGALGDVVAQASAAYGRVAAMLTAPPLARGGEITAPLRGDVAVSHLTLKIGARTVLDDVSFHAPARTRTAILGPTGAGKTLLLDALAGLIRPQSGEILFDGAHIDRYDLAALHKQIGLVFQGSAMFNLTLRENIAFSEAVDDERVTKAIETAELAGFVATLPDGLDTPVSERGTSLSGGQKQRVMLARALALGPRILVLDDFTARVDTRTEERILANVRKNYPDVTLIAVTQKIEPVEDYDNIVLLMEGQVLAQGTHAELMQRSPEYRQIYDSQQSTNDYELRA